MGSPGPPDSAVPSDTDFGAPPQGSSITFGFGQQSVDEDIEDLEAESADNASQNVQQDQQQQQRDNDLLSRLNYNDQHSSEEELEVINSPKMVASQTSRPSTAPEKRKWSQVSNSNSGGPQSQNQSEQPAQQSVQQSLSSDDLDTIVATCSAPVSRAGRELPGSGSSDEEVIYIFYIYRSFSLFQCCICNML